MLDLKYIRENIDAVKRNNTNRLAKVDLDELLKLDDERRDLIGKIDTLRGERNQKSKTKPTEADILKMKAVGEAIAELERQLSPIEEELNGLLLAVPNLTHPAVKVSSDEDDNPVLETFMSPTRFDFVAKDHVALATSLNLIDFDRATKVSGAKFYYLKNDLARLELALVNYAVDVISRHGYEFISTPDLAKLEIIDKLGFSPRGDSTQVYSIEGSDLGLIGTAEITLGGMHADELFTDQSMPKKYVGLSHCYRTEAGSYSKFAKGIFRVHQFTKVEMFFYALPDQSEVWHQEILSIEKEIWQGLNIPFRVVDHGTADLGNPSYRTFDLEAWMPGKPAKDGSDGDWAEVTSASNCTDYQSRGLNIKYKATEGSKPYVHTLNGTGIATSRALIAIMENYQQSDGSIKIPDRLKSYMGGRDKLN